MRNSDQNILVQYLLSLAESITFHNKLNEIINEYGDINVTSHRLYGVATNDVITSWFKIKDLKYKKDKDFPDRIVDLELGLSEEEIDLISNSRHLISHGKRSLKLIGIELEPIFELIARSYQFMYEGLLNGQKIKLDKNIDKFIKELDKSFYKVFMKKVE